MRLMKAAGVPIPDPRAGRDENEDSMYEGGEEEEDEFEDDPVLEKEMQALVSVEPPQKLRRMDAGGCGTTEGKELGATSAGGIDNQETQVHPWPHDRQPSFDGVSRALSFDDCQSTGSRGSGYWYLPETPKGFKEDAPQEAPTPHEQEEQQQQQQQQKRKDEVETTAPKAKQEGEMVADEPKEEKGEAPTLDECKEEMEEQQDEPLVTVGRSRRRAKRCRRKHAKAAGTATAEEVPGPWESTSRPGAEVAATTMPPKPECMKEIKASLSPQEQSGQGEPELEAESQEHEEEDAADHHDDAAQSQCDDDEGSEEEQEEDEEAEEQDDDKPMKRPSARKPAVKAKASAKGKAKAQAKQPGRPKAGPKASAKGKAKAKAKGCARAKAKATCDPKQEEKALKSRKSCAYHRAKREAENAGMTTEEAIDIARTALANHAQDREVGLPVFVFGYNWLVLLLTWTSNIDLEMQIEMLELFSGRGIQDEPLAATIRAYPRDFAKQVLSLWDEERASTQPRLSMRQKVHVSSSATDRELFEGLEVGDCWPDAQMISVWAYLYKNKHLTIPQTWQSTMAKLNSELLDSAPRLPWCYMTILFVLKLVMLRINRYFKPNKKGALKCSEQAMALLNTPGEKIREMLLQHGDFRGVEVQLTKESEQLAQNDTKGGWYSEQAMAQEGYTEYHGNQYHQECIRANLSIMIKNSIRWATARGLTRTNEVHGMEEYKIPLKEEFLFRSSEKQTAKQTGTFEVQAKDANGTLFANSVTESKALQNNGRNTTDVNHARTAMATSAGNAKEKLAGELEPKTKELDEKNKELLKFQTDAVLDAGTPPKRSTKESLLKCYASCTRLDLAINALMVRARNLKLGTPKAKASPKSGGKKGKTPKSSSAKRKSVHADVHLQRLAGGNLAMPPNFGIYLDAESAKGASHMAGLVCKIGAGQRQLDMLYKISSAGQSKTNASRNLHRLIHREGVTLPLEISMVQIPVRKWRPSVKKVMVYYPCIYPSTWMSYLLEKQSYLILGGVDLQEPSKWQSALSDFWMQFVLYDQHHIMNKPGAPPRTHTVPLYLHGDEGRGKYKLPIMVEAVQPHTYTTRFLFSVVPAELYWKDETLDALNGYLCTDLTKLFKDGITALRLQLV
ncbi:unnamed protein product [Symbiodinium microadriaticum]|nr:unnamed protein product [Symbiodinium microadriaticum]CAE7254778.1 unnamed protein product [Symbiodinium sp. KB8]